MLKDVKINARHPSKGQLNELYQIVPECAEVSKRRRTGLCPAALLTQGDRHVGRELKRPIPMSNHILANPFKYILTLSPRKYVVVINCNKEMGHTISTTHAEDTLNHPHQRGSRTKVTKQIHEQTQSQITHQLTNREKHEN